MMLINIISKKNDTKKDGRTSSPAAFLTHKSQLARLLIRAPNYIIPIPAPAAAFAAALSSLISATTDSVVRSVDATLVAF